MSYDRYLSRSRVHNLALLAAVLTAFCMTPASRVVGLLLFVLGFSLQIWSKAVLRRDKVLCTCGPYALCRHPFYLANGLLDWGLCVMAGHGGVILTYPLFFLLAYIPTARNEEQVLGGLFPLDQQQYSRTTARFFPATFRVLKDWRAMLSWTVLGNERQFSRSIRHAAFPLLVIAANRVWAHPVARDPVTAVLLMAVAGLYYLGFVVYDQIEAGSKYDAQRKGIRWIARHSLYFVGIGIPLAIWKAPWLAPLVLALAASRLMIREPGSKRVLEASLPLLPIDSPADTKYG